MPSFRDRLAALLPALLIGLAPAALAAEMAAVVHKASVDVHASPDFNAPTVATLKKDAQVSVSGQQGLWFRVALPAGKSGFVRVTDVRMAYAGKSYTWQTRGVNFDAAFRHALAGAAQVMAGRGRPR